MIVCPNCFKPWLESQTQCSGCGRVVENIDGFLVWSPSLARTNDGFPADGFDRLYQIESTSFWFHSRNRLILWTLRRFAPDFESFLEIGCGTGFVLSGIEAEFPNRQLSGSEIYTNGLQYARKRIPGARLAQMDARSLPYSEEFDVVGAFDVIEHIDEDETALDSTYRAVKPNGIALISVPQHKWLWSPIDEAACHKRRYSSSELHKKLNKAGFHVIFSTSFVTLLIPFMYFSRMISKNKSGQNSREFAMPRFLNFAFGFVMGLEFALIRLGCRLPIGGSRLVAARKQSR